MTTDEIQFLQSFTWMNKSDAIDQNCSDLYKSAYGEFVRVSKKYLFSVKVDIKAVLTNRVWGHITSESNRPGSCQSLYSWYWVRLSVPDNVGIPVD